MDAVLTDYGRQKLAQANSSFSISSFSFGDDEVDYRLIQKYGRTVGKEKIEKNTPIFEALTNQNISIKYRLIGSAANTPLNTIYLPVLKVSPPLSVNLTPNNNNITCTFTLSLNNNSNVTNISDFLETQYKVEFSDRFFNISAGTNVTSDSAGTTTSVAGDPNRTATYGFIIPESTSSFALKISAKSIDNATLNVYGKPASISTRTITSYIKITGQKYGTTLSIPVTYTA